MSQPRKGEDKAEGAYERPYAIAEITHCNQTPASTLFLFGGGGFTRRLRRNPPQIPLVMPPGDQDAPLHFLVTLL